MKRTLLLACSFLSLSGSLWAQQTQKKVAPLIKNKQSSISLDYRSWLHTRDYINENNLSAPSNMVTNTGANTQLPQNPNAAAKTAAISTVKVGTSGNLFTAINSRMNNVFANDALQMVGWAHRQDNFVFIPPGNINAAVANGVIRVDLSLDGGQSFGTMNVPDAYINLGPLNAPPFSDATARPRYPQAAAFLPTGATDPNNTRIVWTSPCTNGNNWGAYQYGVAHNLPDFGKNPVNFVSPTATQGITDNAWQQNQFLPGGLCMGKPGEFWMFDISAQPAGAQTLVQDSLQLWKGTLSEDNNTIDWKLHRAFRPGTIRLSNGSYNATDPNIAFSPDGKWGWACFVGNMVVPGKESHFESIPVLYSTNDGGETWEGPKYVWTRDYSTVTDSIATYYLQNGDTLLSSMIPVMIGYDITVDANGNPHIVGNVLNASKANPHPDSIGFISPGLRKAIFDFTTFDQGQTWCPQFVSYTNTWRGQLNPNFNWNNFIQAARNEAGTHIFYSWIDDLTAADVSSMQPDLFDRAFRITDRAKTAIRNRTFDDPLWKNRALFPSVSPTVLTRTNGEYLIPTVFGQVLTDENSSCNFYFTSNRTYIESDFVAPERDLAFVSVVSPPANSCNQTQVPLTVQLKNIGNQSITGNFWLSYTINGVGPFFSQVPANFAQPNATFDYTFPNQLDLSSGGTFNFNIKVYFAGDPTCENNELNHTATNFIAGGSTVFATDTIVGCGSVTLDTNFPGMPTKWFKGNTELTQFANQAVVQIDESIVGTGAFIRVEITNPNCNNAQSTDQIYVKMVPPPAHHSTFVNQQVCPGNPVILMATDNPGYTVQWSYNGTPVGQGMVYTATTSGTYGATLYDPLSGCSAYKEIMVMIWNISATLNVPAQPQQICAPFTLNAANPQTPNNSGAIFKWYVTGSGNGQTYNNSLLQSGESATFDALINAEGTPVTYKVVVADPIGCKTDSITRTITAFGKPEPKWKVEWPLNSNEDVTTVDNFKLCCDTYIKMSDLSVPNITAISNRQWTYVPSQAAQILGTAGNAQNSGSEVLEVKWPCTRLGLKTLSLIVRSGACVDTINKQIEVVPQPCVVSAHNEISTLEEMTLYPNPFEGIFTVNLRLKEAESVQIAIFDLNGKKLYSDVRPAGTQVEARLNLAHLPAGIYVLKAQTSNGYLSRRIIKQ